ncbi:hypothetical protein L332_03585 [Agrococcus pavilionensis RW1]|uniref:Rho termination factor N-terminal domain-containing protein n=1 Tax=Agrococcus pavilionensis RW1 TaxID=1330458 RepID=U1L972_9MICO|nr:hypothetical protein [Agrococcus pavilionensis]ERG63533.1 hypothetical protein L332_03585 [Agrococcus pavilionensis RW1]
MAERTIRTGLGTYLRLDGQWDYGRQGETVDVHEDDLERFDRLNPAEPEAKAVEAAADGESRDFPEGEPSEEWKVDELKAYAAAREVDLGGATKKADMLAAIEAAAKPAE